MYLISARRRGSVPHHDLNQLSSWRAHYGGAFGAAIGLATVFVPLREGREKSVADAGITGTNLRGVRKLIDDKSIGESVLDAIDGLLSAVIVLSPLVAGPAALPLLALVEPKNELVKITKDAIKTITRSQASDYLDKAARIAAANCLLTFAAYFDALSQLLPGLMKEVGLTEEEKRYIATAAVNPATDDMSEAPLLGQQENAISFQTADLANLTISVPHPAALNDARAARLELYERMSKSTLRLLSGIDAWEDLQYSGREHVTTVVSEQIPALACSVYEAEYLGMAVDFPQFFVWSVLRDQGEKDALIKTVGADLRTQFELVASALQTVDLGLQHLATAIRQIPRAAIVQPLRPDLGAVAEALHRNHEDRIDEPIIDDHYEVDDGRPRLVYPKKVGSYIPQAYRLARYTAETTHFDREDEWNSQPIHDDLGPFLMRHLESPYSVETPLLILGHPGSGKSLFTQVIAARLAYPQYTTVRVQLRDVNPDTDIQAQIEAQIRKDTGQDVNWADFAGNLAMNPPIVILDGYDELLQATGKLFADYLDQVRRFQHREAVQHRPVRVIVTSRITLIDKAIVPPGTTIVRLEEFDEERREAWAAVWNAHNNGYFQQAGIQPFKLPINDKIIQLAKHPLLLLMLALYDSSENKLSSRPDIDQTLLYEELLARFIERERSKGADGAAFTGLPEADRKAEIDREMERLGVAAIGMFNRQDVKIRREELNADLRYFEAEQGAAADGARRMSQADLLLGSFFFIHESRSQLADDSAEGRGPAAFEFLHNTFGEFLAADFILRRVLAEANAVCALSGEAVLGDTLRQRLAIVSPNWFACLIHTPLHTRPNILVLLREWGAHRLSHGSRSQADLLKSLDMIMVAQLRSLLSHTSLPDFSAKGAGAGETSYSPLPVLGHLAIYSLNLILLRCFLDNGTYTLDEADLGAEPGGCRPWDRLVSIWRSWFPLESLGALAGLFTATRRETRIEIEPVRSSLAVPNASNLYTAYNVGVALADNLTAASAGIHVASLMEIPTGFLRDLRTRVQPEVPGLIPVVDSMVPRMFGGGIEELSALLDGEPGERLLATKHPKVPGYMLNIAEMADRLMITPPQQARMSVKPSNFSELASLSRYEAELIVRFRSEFESRWLPYLLCSRDIKRGIIKNVDIREEWRQFLLSPAAAPALRTGLRRLGPAHIAEIAADATDALSDGEVETFDSDTAAALAVLSWRGGAGELCVRSLESIMRACERNPSSLLDIPTETWAGLTDLFVSGDLIIQSQRNRFAALIDATFDATVNIRPKGLETDERAFMKFWVHALRIGITEHREDILTMIAGTLHEASELSSAADRITILLLMRWTHENHDHNLAQRLFSANGDIDWLPIFGVETRHYPQLDIDKIAIELTYREAMDLRWVVDNLRQADNR